MVCKWCGTPMIERNSPPKCNSCILQHKKLNAFYHILEAAKLALDNLPSIASQETINSVTYHETRIKLLLAIEKFEE